VDYTPKDRPDDSPSSDEDRTGNRIRFVARLLGILRARGQDVGDELRDLAEAERAYQAGRQEEATRRVELLLAHLGPGADPDEEGRPTTT
jgi:hypothetical protein